MTRIFVSHASEDKDSFVRPLAHALKAHGLNLWYDEFSLRAGDSLRRSIDHGLSECTAGIVVLSRCFFAKEWPQRELDALFTAEAGGRSRIIPIWHQIDKATVASISPLLADRVAIQADRGVEYVAEEIAKQFPATGKHSGAELAELIETALRPSLYRLASFHSGCQYRFLILNAYREECQEIAIELFSALADDEPPPEFDARFAKEQERLRRKYRIPNDVYLTADEPVHDQHLASYRDAIGEWSSGTLHREETLELIADLDLDELDEYYILLGVPIYEISSAQLPLLARALVEMGCGFEDGYLELESICAQLRTLDEGA